MRSKTKGTVVSIIIAIALIVAAPMATLFSGGRVKAEEVNRNAHIATLFSYTDIATAGNSEGGAKAATTTNGLPAYLSAGNTQLVYSGYTGPTSFDRAGALIRLSKNEGSTNVNRVIVSKPFSIKDNTKEDTLFSFIKAGTNRYTSSKTAKELWTSNTFPILRNVYVKIVEVADPTNYIQAAYNVRQGNDASYEFSNMVISGKGITAGAERGNGQWAAAALVPDHAWGKYNVPSAIYYDAAENKLYADIVGVGKGLNAEGCGKQVVRDFNSNYGDESRGTWTGFNTDLVRIEVSYTGGSADNPLVITHLDGTSLATDADGYINPEATVASYFVGVSENAVEDTPSPLPDIIERNLIKDDALVAPVGYTVKVLDGSGADVTSSAVIGLGANNVYSEDAEMTLGQGEYTVEYAKDGQTVTCSVAVTEKRLMKNPVDLFEGNDGNGGIGLATVSLPVDENGTSTLTPFMSNYANRGVVFDTGKRPTNKTGVSTTQISADSVPVNIADNTKTDSLITLTPFSSGKGAQGNDGITAFTVKVAEKQNPSNYFAVSVFLYGGNSVHAVAGAVGQDSFGYRANLANTEQNVNTLLGSNGNGIALSSMLYKIAYDKTENAVYINDLLIRDFDWEIKPDGEYSSKNDNRDYGAAWSGFTTDEVIITVMNTKGDGKALITDLDGQSLAFGTVKTSDGRAVIVNEIKTEKFAQSSKITALGKAAVSPLVDRNLFGDESDATEDYYVRVTAPSGSTKELGKYSAGLEFDADEYGLYNVSYYGDSAYSAKIASASVKAYDNSLESAFSVSGGTASYDADGIAAANAFATSDSVNLIVPYIHTPASGMKITGSHGSTVTLDRTVYAGDNVYTDKDNFDSLVEFVFEPEYLRYQGDLTVSFTDSKGKSVSVTMQNSQPSNDPEICANSMLNYNNIYVTVTAPNGAGGAASAGQVRHDGQGFQKSRITLRAGGICGEIGTPIKIIYDKQTNSLYMLPVANNTHLTLLRHFSPSAEERTEYGYPSDYVDWEGFADDELKISFSFARGQFAAQNGNPDRTSILVLSVDGQSLALNNGSYGAEKKTLCAPEYADTQVAETVNIVKPDAYTLFADGGKSEYSDFNGKVSVTKDSQTILTERDFAENLSFVPQTSGVYEVNYVLGGVTVKSKITVATVKRTLTFKSGETVLGSVSIDHGGKFTAPSATEYAKTGYTLDGWYSDAELTTAFDFNGTATADASAYAKYTAITYNVGYVLNGGTLVGETYTQTFTVESDEIALPSATKEGFVFQGWYTSPSFTGSAVTSGDYEYSAGDITLYARFGLVSYTVSFVVNGGTAVDDLTLVSGSVIIAPVTTKDGYVFTGWFTDEALTSAYEFGQKGIDGDVTLYAGWKANPPTETVDETPSGSGEIAPPAEEEKRGCAGCGSGASALLASVLAVLACLFVVKRH